MTTNFIALTYKNTINGDLLVLKVFQNCEMIVAVNNQYTNLEGLNWNVPNIIKEYPDLEGKPVGEIKLEGIRRFKDHMRGLLTWDAKKNDLTRSLEPHGYKLQFWVRPDGRLQKS